MEKCKCEIERVIKLSQDTIIYFQNLQDTGGKFEALSFACAVGHDALDTALDIKELLPEINAMGLEDIRLLVVEVLPIVFQAIGLVKAHYHRV